MAVRDGVEAKIEQARRDWEFEWEGERRRLTAEIERLKKVGSADEKKAAARQAILQKLGKASAGSASAGAKSAAQWANEFEDAKMRWEAEKDQLTRKIQTAERASQASTDAVRGEVFQEIRSQYEPKLAEALADRQRLESDLAVLKNHLEAERKRSAERMAFRENAIPEAQQSARTQVTAELKSQYETKFEVLNRLKSRAERRAEDQSEELETERRRLRKQLSQLEEQLKEAREAAYRAQRMGQKPGA
jgi:hypothetical protein